ncbi:MAG: hypothetical protein V1738_01080 [Patescibacteria group bacterium]
MVGTTIFFAEAEILLEIFGGCIFLDANFFSVAVICDAIFTLGATSGLEILLTALFFETQEAVTFLFGTALSWRAV